MKSNEKTAIIEALKKYIARYPSQARAAESLKGVSAATLSQMLNGKHDNISAEMWRSVASQVVASTTGTGWQIVETGAFKEVNMALADAQDYRRVRWIVGEAGCGKTTAATAYANNNREVFKVLCDEDMRKGDFVREIARVMGFKTKGMRIRDILNASIDRLMEMESPLLIFDEGDKLNDNVFHYFINIYNRLEGSCGIVFMSTSYIEQRIERGVNGNRKGYNEIYSRIGRKFFELEPTSPEDVIALCQANGLTERKGISEVIKSTEKSDFDLRCVKGAIHREKRLMKQD